MLGSLGPTISRTQRPAPPAALEAIKSAVCRVAPSAPATTRAGASDERQISSGPQSRGESGAAPGGDQQRDGGGSGDVSLARSPQAAFQHPERTR